MTLYNNTTQFTAIPTFAKATVGYARRDASLYTRTMADTIQNLDKLVEEVERDLLSHIYANLKTNEISAEDAQKLAQDFLKLLPFKDKRDLLEKLNMLGHEYRTAQEVYMKFGVPFEEQQRQMKLDQMREHIKNGDIDKALEVAKEHVQNFGNATVGEISSSNVAPLDAKLSNGGKGGDQNAN